MVLGLTSVILVNIPFLLHSLLSFGLLLHPPLPRRDGVYGNAWRTGCESLNRSRPGKRSRNYRHGPNLRLDARAHWVKPIYAVDWGGWWTKMSSR
ncbi:hypothetical protein BDN72DRAFT_179990 [Pluteus cervinus]|uniref:Uncharacterized protein n=1 Tax=Pluteus cervinus TaxID=181527 RepID=A0ACD3ALJ8_9AGAR|nr:hypothetical protein BDN72DRAFT_179990 [Pluteus cervinus]